jgi:ribA/ribD-fused uncharacterized protein
MSKLLPISGFHGDYRWLSNFTLCEVELEGVMYPTVEHAYQAAKTTVKEFREAIRLCTTPGQAKRMGKQITLRPDWEAIKLDVMRGLLREKFSWGYLRVALLATGERELIEENTWYDTFWGVCYGEGQNWLGKLLMEIREELRGNRS